MSGVAMLGYHEFAETQKDVYALSAESFRDHIRIVGQRKSGVDCVTFDDGHLSQFVVAAPILEEFAVKAIFFITTAWTGCKETAMTREQIRELARRGHTVGSHTHTHPMLTACTPSGLRMELGTSKSILEDQLGVEVSNISIPGGRVSAEVLRACAEAGYRRVFTSRVAEHTAAAASNPEVIGRLIVRRATTQQTLDSYLAGSNMTWRRLQLESMAKQVVKSMVGDSLYHRVWRKAVRSQSYGV